MSLGFDAMDCRSAWRHPQPVCDDLQMGRVNGRFRRPGAFAVAVMLLAACVQQPPTPSVGASPVPEAASGFQAKAAVTASRHMVAAANPLATQAGLRVLDAGGNAVDAAVAVQMVLTLVEPQSSGIGGGAFLMHWDGRTVQAFDGRETAPAAADQNLFLQPDGKPMAFMQAAVGGRAVGVPGVVRMLELAHRQHGKLACAALFADAIELSEKGFSVSERLHTLLRGEQALKLDPLARRHFYDEHGEPVKVGHVLRNPAMAKVLRDIAARGSVALHEGPVASDIVARVASHPTNPGRLSFSDLANYQPKPREPICTLWRMRWRVCGFPPPSSGHLTVMQILGLVERLAPTDDRVTGAPRASAQTASSLQGPDFLHRYAEAAKLAYADRAHYIADPDFVQAPGGSWATLLEASYLAERAKLIGEQSGGAAQPGVPVALARAAFLGTPVQATPAWPYASMPDQPEYGTSHVSIVDGDGRSVSMTTTIEAVFGSRLMSDGGTGLQGGFLLNNQLTDFSLAPSDAQGRPIANRVQAGKRPRSSMSPTLVFDARDGRLMMSIHFTAKTLLGTLQLGLDAQQAIALPNFGNQNGPTQLERGRFEAATIAALKARGHQVVEVDLTSGLQAIQRTQQGGRDAWLGGADPRREGVVMGR
jgi:gamma-glutamyltranspeptidase / glutathione hydrolase